MLHIQLLISKTQNKLKLFFLLCIVFIFSPQVNAQSKAPTASILSEGLQKEVAVFIKKHPEMKDEFLPFQQDCIDGKTAGKLCETEVKLQLIDLENEIRVNEKEARANEKEARVKAVGEMLDRVEISITILEINNSIQHGNPNRNMKSIGRNKNPILQTDILFVRSIDQKLNQKALITSQEIAMLQAMLITHAQEALKIYSTLTPADQQDYKDTKDMAIGVQKYVIKQ